MVSRRSLFDFVFSTVLSAREQVDYIKDHYWRLWRAEIDQGLAKLKAEALAVFSDATDEVTLTGTSSEGGSVQGQVKFNKMLVGMALNELIKAIDSTWTTPPAAPAEREIAATVWLG